MEGAFTQILARARAEEGEVIQAMRDARRRALTEPCEAEMQNAAERAKKKNR